MGVTVKFCPEYEGMAGDRKTLFSWGLHDSATLRAGQSKSVKAGRGGHAVYQDRQGALIEALCECAFEDEPNYKRIDRGMDTAFVAEHGFHCEKKPIKLPRHHDSLGAE